MSEAVYLHDEIARSRQQFELQIVALIALLKSQGAPQICIEQIVGEVREIYANKESEYQRHINSVFDSLEGAQRH